MSDDLSDVLDDATYNDDAGAGATYREPVLSWSGAWPSAHPSPSATRSPSTIPTAVITDDEYRRRPAHELRRGASGFRLHDEDAGRVL